MSESADKVNRNGVQVPGWRSSASHALLLKRALMLKSIRAFFDAKGIIEVETPLLSRSATTDPQLDSLSCRFRDQACYLNTSPEYAMKRLLADWKKPIYQICKAFRDDELGARHNPEFSMLEWYRPDYAMPELMAELADLVGFLCQSTASFSATMPAFERLSYQQAFEKYAGINPHRATSRDCYQLARSKNIEIPQGLGASAGAFDERDEWLDWLLLQRVLPAFEKQAFTYLYDYPVTQCALAKIAPAEVDVGVDGSPIQVAKRFELFYGEVELANGFFELTDAEEQLQRFRQENNKRKLMAKQLMPVDENFIAALKYGLPACSGVALGLDRLLMVLAGEPCIDRVLSFSWVNS